MEDSDEIEDFACVLACSRRGVSGVGRYFIVQNNKTHKCSLAKTKPSESSKTVALVGDGTAYKTKSEATTAMGTMDACKANPT